MIKDGKNLLTILFESNYAETDGYGLHKFRDVGVNEWGDEFDDLYVYSVLTHEIKNGTRNVFPCFYQPNIKVTYEMMILAPKEWYTVLC